MPGSQPAEIKATCFEPFDGKFHKRLMGTDSIYENAIYDVSVFVEADIKGKQI